MKFRFRFLDPQVVFRAVEIERQRHRHLRGFIDHALIHREAEFRRVHEKIAARRAYSAAGEDRGHVRFRAHDSVEGHLGRTAFDRHLEGDIHRFPQPEVAGVELDSLDRIVSAGGLIRIREISFFDANAERRVGDDRRNRGSRAVRGRGRAGIRFRLAGGHLAPGGGGGIRRRDLVLHKLHHIELTVALFNDLDPRPIEHGRQARMKRDHRPKRNRNIGRIGGDEGLCSSFQRQCERIDLDPEPAP